MGTVTGIEWTDHTFNPWIGCVKVSDGCKHCYAETLNHRWGHDNWGPAATTTRRRTTEENWKKPISWNKAAEKAGVRKRVFCASMADVFEDHPQVAPWRADLFKLVTATPWLDWQILTKRPENIARFAPVSWGADNEAGTFDDPILFPQNVWMGTSVENQTTAEERIPHLLRVPVKVRFLSMEPLLGPVDLRLFDAWLEEDCYEARERLHWVIVGGESGKEVRPMHPDWVRSLRDQCVAAGVSFFFKQWGEFVSWSHLHYLDGNGPYGPTAYPWTTDPNDPKQDSTLMVRAGKKAAGRLLDGQEWSQFPT